MVLKRLRQLFGVADAQPMAADDRIALLRTRADYHARERERLQRQITDAMSEPAMAKMREAGW